MKEGRPRPILAQDEPGSSLSPVPGAQTSADSLTAAAAGVQLTLNWLQPLSLSTFCCAQYNTVELLKDPAVHDQTTGNWVKFSTGVCL